MPRTPEDRAREQIDALLIAAGWAVQDRDGVNLGAARGIAVREFPLVRGHGTADYLLYGDRRALGVIEAKQEGETLAGVEVQTEKYGAGLPPALPAWRSPLPFLYQSTGVETQFTNMLDVDPRSRAVFSFHRPATLIGWAQGLSGIAVADTMVREPQAPELVPTTLSRRLREPPPLVTAGMRVPQIEAINNLERSLAVHRPRALVQMATGSGKTYTAVALIYGSSSTRARSGCCSWWTAATWRGRPCESSSSTRPRMTGGSLPSCTTSSTSSRMSSTR
jgi:type I restriction enzyme R subunit